MLRVEAESMFGADFVVIEGRREVAWLRLRWRDRGEVELDGETLDVRFQGFFAGRWTLVSGERALATAEKGAFSGRQVQIAYAGEELVLRAEHWLSRGYELVRGARRLGRVRPASLWTRAQHAEFDDDVDPRLQVFTLWLVVMLRRRARRRS